MNIRSTRPKAIVWAIFGFSSFLFSLVLVSIAANFTSATSQSQLPETELEEFAQNNILFYDPSQCIGGTSSGVCGSTAEEKIWSILRQTLDPIHAAAAFGSIANEGGFQPVKWEYGNVVSLSTCNFVSGMTWDDLYNGVYDGRYGVGSFGLTSGLSDYLHYINDNAPDLLKYFKDPSNTCYATGDELAEAIGESEYDRLIELEVNYFINEWIGESRLSAFKSITDLEEAAIYWAHDIEVCAACGYDGGSSQLTVRASAAEGYYEKYKDFTCTASSSGSSGSNASVSSEDITLIGDSIAVMSEEELQEKFPNSYLTMVGSRHSTSGGACAGDKGGLDILQKLSDGSGTILTQHHNKNSCDEITIDKNSLKDNVVWELGTNSVGASKETIEKVIKLVGDYRRLFLVTPYNGDSRAKDDTEAIAQMYRDVAEEYDNVYVVDWANAVKDSGYTYVYAEPSMTVHPTDEGKELLAKLISEAVSGSSGCTTYEGEYPQYNQCGDLRWSTYSYSTDNICGSGCGAASMAMLATVATGQDIFPNDIADLLGDQYYDSVSVHTLDPIVGEHYGFEVIKDSSSTEEETKTKFRQYLKDGYMIHFTGAGHYPGFYPLSDGSDSRGHVIGLFDIDSEDNVTQANSGWGNQKVSLDDMAKAKTWDEFTAIKGNGSKDDCNNLCNNNSNDSFASLNEEQAQKIADYYNSNEVTAENFIGGYIPSDCSKMNCVSFSLWFVSAFTDAAEISPTPSLVGNGSYIADTGLPSIGWETGNDPTPYSVFGGAGSSAWSHTGVVVGTTDDGNILTIEAAYINHGSGCVGWDAQVTTRDPSYFSEGVGILAYPGNHLTPNEGHLGNKSLNEIIGS